MQLPAISCQGRELCTPGCLWHQVARIHSCLRQEYKTCACACVRLCTCMSWCTFVCVQKPIQPQIPITSCPRRSLLEVNCTEQGGGMALMNQFQGLPRLTPANLVSVTIGALALMRIICAGTPGGASRQKTCSHETWASPASARPRASNAHCYKVQGYIFPWRASHPGPSVTFIPRTLQDAQVSDLLPTQAH